MFILSVENYMGERLQLTQNESNYQVLNIDGLNPPNAQINRTSVAGMDGSKFNSSKLNERALTISIKICGNVEKNRIKLYSFFNSKQWCKIFYKNNTRDVYIEGYCETALVNLFTNNEIFQVTIVCPNPYFKAINEIITDASLAKGLFTFPFSFGGRGATNGSSPTTDNAIPFSSVDMTKTTHIINNSESETGVIINAVFIGAVNKLTLKNINTGEEITLTFAFKENDILNINTNKGNKSIVLIRNAIEINMFPYLAKNSIFFQLHIGDNPFSYIADNSLTDTNVRINFKHYTIYGGV